MALRFATAVGLFASLAFVGIYFFCRDTQIQLVDSDLETSTTLIGAQFQAQAQTKALTDAAKQATNDQNTGCGDDDDQCARQGASKRGGDGADSDGGDGDGGVPNFVNTIGADQDRPADYDSRLFVRLVDQTGATAAESPSVRGLPGIDASLRSISARGSGLAHAFAGGGSLPVLRVETTDLKGYRLQVALAWHSQAAWLVGLAEWLAGALALSTFLAGCGGYAVARRLREPVVTKQTGAVVAMRSIEEDSPVKRRALTEAIVVEKQADVVEEKPESATVKRYAVEDEEEQQVIGRIPPDI